jgi:hypothetical protein
MVGFTIAAYLMMLHKLFLKKAQPNPVSWGIWMFNDILVAYGAFLGHASTTAYLAATNATFSLIIAFAAIALRRTDKKPLSGFEKVALLVVCCGLLFWFFAGDPSRASGILVGAMLIGGIPSVIDVWKNPKGESLRVWGSLLVGDICAVVQLRGTDLTLAKTSEWAFPLGGTLMCLVMVLLILRRK